MIHTESVLLNLFSIFILVAGYSIDIEGLPKNTYQLDGDINIGAVFPLHEAGTGGAFCGRIRELGVLQRAEAMAFYIRQINKSQKSLPNITLGFTILDDCYKETTALAQGLKFLPAGSYLSGYKNMSSNRPAARSDFIAVIGAESSTNSKQLAELFGLFKLPQISYLSTSPSLGNKVAYPYFTRIVPSDKFQVAAIIDLVQHFNWSYISFVYSYNFYGLEAYFLLLENLRNLVGSNMCLALEFGLPINPTEENYAEAVSRLVGTYNRVPSHVVILFLPQMAATGILTLAQKLGYAGKFTFIASDAWGRNAQDFHGVEDIGLGSLTMKIASSNDPTFDKHFASLNAAKAKDLGNEFASEFLETACQQSSRKCDERTTFGELSDVYHPESTVSLVKMSVLLLESALADLFLRCRRDKLGKNCNGKEFREYINSDELQKLLWNKQGCVDNNCVDIDQYGEGQTKYSIMNFQRNPHNYTLQEIGSYNTKKGILEMTTPPENITWNPKILNFENDVPLSICSSTCKMGQRQKQMGYDNSRCCWICEDCSKHEYTNITMIDGLPNYQCQQCEKYTESKLYIYTSPVQSGDGCEKIVPQSMDVTDPFTIVILTLDVVCLLLTSALLVIYVKNKTHRLIKATSLELSYIIWFGVIFSYVSLLFYFLPLQTGCKSPGDCNNASPNTYWCYLQFLTFSLSFTTINAPMLTRVNRIYRIFKTGKKSAAKPKFIETKYQLIIVGVLVAVQALVVVICCLVSHFGEDGVSIKINNHQADKNPTESYIACEIPYPVLLPPIIYNLLLGLACAYHAFVTRKLPDNFNESRFIGMTVYTTVIIWIAFIPAYITINSYYYKGVPLSVALLINAIITTGCLFVPRLYALRWVEGGRMNLRSMSMSLHSIGDKTKHSTTLDAKPDRKRSASSESTSPIARSPPKYFGNKESSSYESGTSTTPYLSEDSFNNISPSSSRVSSEYDAS